MPIMTPPTAPLDHPAQRAADASYTFAKSRWWCKAPSGPWLLLGAENEVAAKQLYLNAIGVAGNDAINASNAAAGNSAPLLPGLPEVHVQPA